MTLPAFEISTSSPSTVVSPLAELQQKLETVPAGLSAYNLALADDGKALIYVYEAQGEHRGVTRLIEELFRNNIRLKDIATTQSSLEDIFVDLVRHDR